MGPDGRVHALDRPAKSLLSMLLKSEEGTLRTGPPKAASCQGRTVGCAKAVPRQLLDLCPVQERMVAVWTSINTTAPYSQIARA